MGFLEDILEDLDEVFFDEDFYGSKHKFDGKDITVILAGDELLDNSKNKSREERRSYRDELIKKSLLLYVQEKDIERKLSVNSEVSFDGRMYFVHEESKQSGVWRILLGKEQI